VEWVKLYATPPYYLDGALLRAGEAAEVLFCRALAHCGNTETRGRVDKAVVPLLTPTKPAARAAALVREQLWLDEGDHYVIRSWGRLQDEHDAAAVKRAQDRDRQRAARQRKSGSGSDSARTETPASRDASRDGHADSRVTTGDNHALDVEVDREVPTTQLPHSAAPSATAPTLVKDDDSAFDEWWKVYPRKVAKQDARKAYRAARKTASAERLLDGARRYRADTTRQDQFTAYPASWLNAGRWDDEGPAGASQPNRDAQGRLCPVGMEHLPTYERFIPVNLG